jgi:phosphoribosylanthranilate isomerase
MWVKICGNTNLEDAQLAAELGADALGFVFAESKRQVTAAQVARITPHLPAHVERVGVFYSRDAKEIASVVREAGLNAAQLHGGVDLDLTRRLREVLGGAFDLIQTVHWTVGADSSAALSEQLRQINLAGAVNRVLIDSRVGMAGGGTGVAFDWRAAGAVIEENAGELKVIVAGGLRPDNVGEAIRELSPWGVDVVSGVEASPGRKDPEKLAEFLRLARTTK